MLVTLGSLYLIPRHPFDVLLKPLGVSSFDFSFLPSEGHFPLAILLIFVGSFLFGLLPATAAAPPLPKVEITKRDKGEAVPDPLKGYLVAHSDGFWHLFNEKNQLLSIPDHPHG
jgi:hypothetical protein